MKSAAVTVANTSAQESSLEVQLGNPVGSYVDRTMNIADAFGRVTVRNEAGRGFCKFSQMMVGGRDLLIRVVEPNTTRTQVK